MNNRSDRFLLLTRIADALDRLAPPISNNINLDVADAFVWNANSEKLEAITQINRIDISLLHGIDVQRDILLDNTRRFSRGLSTNNALLWGARGTGKSSLIKAVHAKINEEIPHALALVEIHREDITSFSCLLTMLCNSSRRILLFCDDLSFNKHIDDSYKSLKTALDGSIKGRPSNVVFYATSNRRHLMSRNMIENERSTAIHPEETTEENISISDRFGLWIGFHKINQETFLAIIENYAKAFCLPIAINDLHKQAIEWSINRGARSGRVAWQFIQDVAGRLDKSL
ncbi:MAG: ATP-binding protein [Rhodospirillaceae bacterium]|jgi:predicted AAA+ superfamily ATPase|nr:ATP-binding protein [Rhodospirillaceae bacterium]